MAHAIRIRGSQTAPLHADVRQYLVDQDDLVVGRMHVRRSGEVHMVWDSGDRLVCCWSPSSGALGFDAGAEFRLWTYRAHENVHECLAGERALQAAHHYFSCIEYSDGPQTEGLPAYLAREWWERWREEGSMSPSSEAGPSRHKRTASRSTPYPQQQGQVRPFYRPRAADRADSMSSLSSLSSDDSPTVTRTVVLDPHVNERIRRLESALIWHSNILERIVHCRHHECAHSDDEEITGVKCVSPGEEEDVGSKLRRLESLSGDIDLRLKRVQLCEGCA